MICPSKRGFKHHPLGGLKWNLYNKIIIKYVNYGSGQIIATSAEVTLDGGLVREYPPNPLNSGLGIIVICPVLFNQEQCLNIYTVDIHLQPQQSFILFTPAISVPLGMGYIDWSGPFPRPTTQGLAWKQQKTSHDKLQLIWKRLFWSTQNSGM